MPLPNSEKPIYDVIIIGAGPGGTTAGIYAARARMKTVMLDKARIGGQLANSPRMANYPGFPEPIDGRALMERMRIQAEQQGAEFVQAEVGGVDLSHDPKRVFTTSGEFLGKTVIIAAGAGERKNKLPGEEEFLGRGVSYCAVCDGPFFRGEEVAVVGDDNHAVEEALFLSRYASRIHLLIPRSELRAQSPLREELAGDSRLVLHPETRVKQVVGNDCVTGLLAQRKEDDPETLPVSGVFFYLTGGMPATAFLSGVLDLDEKGYIRVNEYMETAVPGVFAVGDIRCGPLKQVVTACADGALAAMGADRYIRKRPHLMSAR